MFLLSIFTFWPVSTVTAGWNVTKHEICIYLSLFFPLITTLHVFSCFLSQISPALLASVFTLQSIHIKHLANWFFCIFFGKICLMLLYIQHFIVADSSVTPHETFTHRFWRGWTGSWISAKTGVFINNNKKTYSNKVHNMKLGKLKKKKKM